MFNSFILYSSSFIESIIKCGFQIKVNPSYAVRIITFTSSTFFQYFFCSPNTIVKTIEITLGFILLWNFRKQHKKY